ncbi:MAG: glycosyltransferase [Acidobacteriota bacterium]
MLDSRPIVRSGRSGPTVSIITSTFEARAFVEHYVAALEAQTIDDWECWLVDDGSEDGTLDAFAERIGDDPRFHLVARPHSGRPAPNRAYALERARGRYVAFCDQDDFWFPHKLERQLRAFELHPDAVLCHTSRRFVDAENLPYTPPADAPGDERIVTDTTERALLERCAVTCSSVMARRDSLRAVDGFAEDLAGVDDYHLWLKLARYGDLVWIRAPLVVCTLHGRNMSASPKTLASGLLRLADRLEHEQAPRRMRRALRAHALKASAVAGWIERPLRAVALLARSWRLWPRRRTLAVLTAALLTSPLTRRRRRDLWRRLQDRRSRGLTGRATSLPPRAPRPTASRSSV